MGKEWREGIKSMGGKGREEKKKVMGRGPPLWILDTPLTRAPLCEAT